jgi:hypothetical protein
VWQSPAWGLQRDINKGVEKADEQAKMADKPKAELTRRLDF